MIAFGSFIPSLQFNSRPDGITYSTQNGSYLLIDGSWCIFHLSIILTSKGANAGSARISGLPFKPVAPSIRFAPAVAWANITLLLNAVSCSLNVQGDGTALLLLNEMGNNQPVTPLTDLSFSNNSQLTIDGGFQIAP